MFEDKGHISIVTIDWKTDEGAKWQILLEPERLMVLKGGNRLNHVGVVVGAVGFLIRLRN